MKKIFFLMLVLVFVTFSASCSNNSKDDPPSLEEVEDIIMSFRNHLAKGDYERAREYVTDRVIVDLQVRIGEDQFPFLEHENPNPLEVAKHYYASTEEDVQAILDSLSEEDKERIETSGKYFGAAYRAGWIKRVEKVEESIFDNEINVYVIINAYMYNSAEHEYIMRLVQEGGKWKIDSI